MKLRIAIAVTLLGVMVFLAFNRHSKDKFNNYHSVLWADAAGYYVYLPLFFSDFFLEASTEDIQKTIKETGEGFKVEKGLVNTKYTYGTALLEAPFYLLIKMVFPDRTPFSREFHRAIIFAGALYSWLGLILLYLTFRKQFSESTSALVPLIVLLTTNVFYYALDSGGMSHAYSFFSFAGLCWTCWNLEKSKSYFLAFIFFLALTIVIRPINLVGIPFLIGMLVCFRPETLPALKKHLQNTGFLILGACLVCFMVLPQVLYWKYAFGAYLVYSYEGEGFTNLVAPHVQEVLFSSNNGLFLYTPFWFLLVFAAFYLAVLKRGKTRLGGGILIGLFITITYLFASWWNWHFGCGFGHRAYVEFLVPFSFGFAMFMEENKNPKVAKGFLWTSVIIFSIWNLKLTYSFDECWYYGVWDYQEFLTHMLLAKTR